LKKKKNFIKKKAKPKYFFQNFLSKKRFNSEVNKFRNSENKFFY
jgi:hypothetical protein